MFSDVHVKLNVDSNITGNAVKYAEKPVRVLLLILHIFGFLFLVGLLLFVEALLRSNWHLVHARITFPVSRLC